MCVHDGSLEVIMPDAMQNVRELITKTIPKPWIAKPCKTI